MSASSLALLPRFETTASCDLQRVREAVIAMRGVLDQWGLSTQVASELELATQEAANNAVEHVGPAGRDLPVRLVAQALPQALEIRVLDHTPGFRLPEVIEPPDPESEGGRGLFLMDCYTSEMDYRCGRHGNEMLLRRNLDQPVRIPQPLDEEMQETLREMEDEILSCYEILSAIPDSLGELAQSGDDFKGIGPSLQKLLKALRADWFLMRQCQPAPDGQGRLVTLVATDGMQPEDLRKGSQSLEATAAQTRKDQWFGRDAPLEDSDPLRVFGPELSGVAHPIFLGEDLFGVLTVGMRNPDGELNAGQLNVLHLFAEFLSIQIEAARARESMVRSRLVHREIEIAANLQRSLLPARLPVVPGLDLAARARSAHQVGGDFYDAITGAEPGLLLAIADVMGKGVPAALFATIFRSHLHSRPDLVSQPGAFMRWLNRVLFADLDRVDMFITAQLVWVDPAAGTLRVAAAGHCEALLHRDGELLELGTEGVPLGILPDGDYPEIEVPLGKNSRLLCFTDGLIETRNPAGETLNIEPVREWMTTLGSISGEEACDRLENLAARFRDGAELSDDLTFILLSTSDSLITR